MRVLIIQLNVARETAREGGLGGSDLSKRRRHFFLDSVFEEIRVVQTRPADNADLQRNGGSKKTQSLSGD